MFSLGSFPDPIAGTAKPTDVIAGGYTQISQKYFHNNGARNALGLVGGNEVSMITGNLVDLESDLRGVTRDLSRAPARKYQPSCALGSAGKEPSAANSLSPFTGGPCAAYPKRLVFTERGTGKVIAVNTTPRHLPTTQYVSYPGVPAPEVFNQEVYGAPWRF
jgi:hypothetical protein